MKSPKPSAKGLRVAAVWGTDVLAVRHLHAGEPLRVGDRPDALCVIPDGLTIPEEPLRALGSSWELDARGATGGTLRLRGRDEDPSKLGEGAVPLVAGDYGLLQYGNFGLFFQFAEPLRLAAQRPRLDYGLVAAFAVACFAVGGTLSALKQIAPADPLAKPVELTSTAELSRRLRLPKVAPTIEASTGGGEQPKKDDGGSGRPMPGDQGKLGKRAISPTTKVPGNRPGLGGVSEVLAGSVGEEVKATLGSISSVAAALGGLRSDRLVLGEGSGTGLRGSGSSGGGDGPSGVPYGAGTLDTGQGAGQGSGAGTGRGLGSGNGHGVGAGTKPAERQLAAANAAPPGQGLGPGAVQRVVMSRYGAFRACYDSATASDPQLSGTVSVSFRIAPGGTVQSASITGSSLKNPRVEGCILRQIKRLRFPSADKGTSANYPFAFKPSKR